MASPARTPPARTRERPPAGAIDPGDTADSADSAGLVDVGVLAHTTDICDPADTADTGDPADTGAPLARPSEEPRSPAPEGRHDSAASAPVDLRDRARGALLGLAVGDALGAPAENLRPSEIRARWGRVTGYVTDHPAGTDDTEYAMFSGLLLARHGSALTVAHVEAAWHHWIADRDEGPFRGAGFSERGTLENLRRGLAAPISAQHRHAWSDGLAMRAAPFGVFAAGRPAEAARLVAIDGSVSHEGEGIYGGQAVAAGVAAAMAGAPVGAVVASALAVVPEDSWTARSLRRAVTAAHRGERAVRSAVVVGGYPWTDLAPEAVALAFGAYAAADGEFREAVLTAVNMGRDADTTAAVTGALAGATGGAGAIPADWAAAIGPSRGTCLPSMRGHHVEEVADALVTAATRPAPTTPRATTPPVTDGADTTAATDTTAAPPGPTPARGTADARAAVGARGTAGAPVTPGAPPAPGTLADAAPPARGTAGRVAAPAAGPVARVPGGAMLRGAAAAHADTTPAPETTDPSPAPKTPARGTPAADMPAAPTATTGANTTRPPRATDTTPAPKTPARGTPATDMPAAPTATTGANTTRPPKATDTTPAPETTNPSPAPKAPARGAPAAGAVAVEAPRALAGGTPVASAVTAAAPPVSDASPARGLVLAAADEEAGS
ncbi:ADP-ribosylglycohydrolase family protein [Streptomyces griseoaurantiacus]|uniref:ADP-ribosylglycohydrolase family protein n=1 Tax=Streptomyces griseoaurantiacus TaxID=68213 RepID=UPI0030E0E5EC